MLLAAAADVWRADGVSDDGPFLQMRRNPYLVYDQMRIVSPVFHLAPFNLWMIFDFEGVKQVLVDHDTFSSDPAHVPGHGNLGE